jgi:hypothetical protein
LIIVVTSIFAITAQFISIQFVVVSGAIFTLLLTTVLLYFNIQPSKKKYYKAAIVVESKEINQHTGFLW